MINIYVAITSLSVDRTRLMRNCDFYCTARILNYNTERSWTSIGKTQRINNPKEVYNHNQYKHFFKTLNGEKQYPKPQKNTIRDMRNLYASVDHAYSLAARSGTLNEIDTLSDGSLERVEGLSK